MLPSPVHQAAPCAAPVARCRGCHSSSCASARWIAARRDHGVTRERRHRAHRLFQRLGAAQSAAGAPRQVAPPVLQLLEAFVAERDRDLETQRMRLRRDVVDLRGALDDAFGQAETEREILEVRRRHHHHDVREAVVAERDRRFERDRVARGTRPAPGSSRQRVTGTLSQHSSAVMRAASQCLSGVGRHSCRREPHSGGFGVAEPLSG